MEALLAAAHVLASVDLASDAECAKRIAGATAGPDGSIPTADCLQATDMLAEAAALARRQDRNETAERLEQAKLPSPGRGTTRRMDAFHGMVQASGQSEHEFLFLGEEIAEVSLSPRRGARLAMSVHRKADDGLVAGSPDIPHPPWKMLTWTPAKDATFVVRVRNLGDTDGDFWVITN